MQHLNAKGIIIGGRLDAIFFPVDTMKTPDGSAESFFSPIEIGLQKIYAIRVKCDPAFAQIGNAFILVDGLVSFYMKNWKAHGEIEIRTSRILRFKNWRHQNLSKITTKNIKAALVYGYGAKFIWNSSTPEEWLDKITRSAQRILSSVSVKVIPFHKDIMPTKELKKLNLTQEDLFVVYNSLSFISEIQPQNRFSAIMILTFLSKKQPGDRNPIILNMDEFIEDCKKIDARALTFQDDLREFIQKWMFPKENGELDAITGVDSIFDLIEIMVNIVRKFDAAAVYKGIDIDQLSDECSDDEEKVTTQPKKRRRVYAITSRSIGNHSRLSKMLSNRYLSLPVVVEMMSHKKTVDSIVTSHDKFTTCDISTIPRPLAMYHDIVMHKADLKAAKAIVKFFSLFKSRIECDLVIDSTMSADAQAILRGIIESKVSTFGQCGSHEGLNVIAEIINAYDDALVLPMTYAWAQYATTFVTNPLKVATSDASNTQHGGRDKPTSIRMRSCAKDAKIIFVIGCHDTDIRAFSQVFQLIGNSRKVLPPVIFIGDYFSSRVMNGMKSIFGADLAHLITDKSEQPHHALILDTQKAGALILDPRIGSHDIQWIKDRIGNAHLNPSYYYKGGGMPFALICPDNYIRFLVAKELGLVNDIEKGTFALCGTPRYTTHGLCADSPRGSVRCVVDVTYNGDKVQKVSKLSTKAKIAFNSGLSCDIGESAIAPIFTGREVTVPPAVDVVIFVLALMKEDGSIIKTRAASQLYIDSVYKWASRATQSVYVIDSGTTGITQLLSHPPGGSGIYNTQQKFDGLLETIYNIYNAKAQFSEEK